MIDPADTVSIEQHLLASLLLDPTAMRVVNNIISVEDFLTLAHATIYAVLLELAAQRVHGYIALAAELECRGLLEAVGGRSYLLSMAAVLPVGFDAVLYAEVVRRLAQERRQAHEGEQE